jgi:hypothetical protein
MAALPIKVVAQLLSLREFISLCSQLDDREKEYTRFRVIEVNRTAEQLLVTVRTTKGKDLVVKI